MDAGTDSGMDVTGPANPPARAAGQGMEDALRGPGFRMTRQRKVVYDVLMEMPDHPTATDVFLRAKERMQGISLATVYNCLETLNEAGMVKLVQVDRSASRYCPNLRDHAHFYCRACGKVEDIAPLEEREGWKAWRLREGTRVDHAEVALKGLCPECASRAAEALPANGTSD